MLMQYLAIAVVIVVFLFACRWYKQTVIVWMVAQTLLNAQIAVRYSAPAMSCVLATDIVLLGLYFFKKQNHYFRLEEKFLFKTPMIVVFSSFLLSALFANVTPIFGITATIKYFLSNFIILYIFQQCLQNYNDLKLFFKAVFIIAFLQIGNALYESIYQDNLWLDFVYFNSPHDATTLGRMYYVPPQLGKSLEMRYGMVRARSFFGLHITFGFYCLMYLFLLATHVVKKWNIVSNKIFLKIAIALLFIGILMGNSKTSYIGLAILLFSVCSAKQIFNIKILLPLIVVFFVVFLYFPEYLNNFISLFDSKVAEEGGGSTVEGRQVQFQVAQKMFEMAPFFGNGPGSIGLLKSQGFEGILGAESSWMQILPERGLYGAAAYIFAYVCIFKRFKPVLGIKMILLFLLAIFVMETATGILDMSIWGTVLIVVRKSMLLKQQENLLTRGTNL